MPKWLSHWWKNVRSPGYNGRKTLGFNVNYNRKNKMKREWQHQRVQNRRLKRKKQVQKDMETIQAGIAISEELMKAGQQELKGLTKMAKVDRVSLMAASAKISSSMKWKEELEKELEFLNEKLKNLEELCFSEQQGGVWTFFKWWHDIMVLSFVQVNFVALCVCSRVDHPSNSKGQKQPPEVFCKKRCSEKFHKIHRKTSVLESLF